MIRPASRHPSGVGPYLGLTPKKYQSGETDYTGRISRHGDASVREALLRGGPHYA